MNLADAATYAAYRSKSTPKSTLTLRMIPWALVAEFMREKRAGAYRREQNKEQHAGPDAP